jgi:DNA repair protein RadC
LLGIAVVDHLVFGAGRWISLKRARLGSALDVP